MENVENIYSIPKDNLKLVEEKVAKINGKAEKLQSAGLRIEILEEFLEKYDGEAMIEMVKIQVIGAAPKLAGWTFIAKLDHFSLPGNVIIKAVPGATIPQEALDAIHLDSRQKDAALHEINNLRSSPERIKTLSLRLEEKPYCDHCHTYRRRNDTFIVQHESGAYKQVGRTCLKDFLGHSPEGLLRYLSQLNMFFTELEDHNSGWYKFRGWRNAYVYELKEALEISAAFIRTYGFVSKQKATMDNPSTASLVSGCFGYYTNATDKPDVKDCDIQEAQEATDWVSRVEDKGDNDYIFNLKRIVKAGHFSGSMFGLVASIIAAYRRANPKVKIEKLNEWVGNPKDKIETTVKIVGSYASFGWMGTTVTIYKMLDDQNRSLTWFSSATKGISMEEGKVYKIKGRIKAHEEYKGWKQTILTRVTVIQEEKQAA